MGEKLIAKMVCSGKDCKTTYFAELIETNGRWEIGPKVEAPVDASKCRVQRMQCGDCRAMHGDDLMTRLMRQQRGESDPFGLGL